LLGALKVMKGWLWGWASLFIGPQLGKLEFIYQGLWEMVARGSGVRASLSVGAL
jgi:hypothetical protein